MASGRRSSWPTVLLLGLCISLILGAVAAVAAPSRSGRPWWHDGGTERITGTVLDLDREARTFTLDGLVGYHPVRAGLGTLTIEVGDKATVAPSGKPWSDLRPGDTIDVEVRRHDGAWTAQSITHLDPE